MKKFLLFLLIVFAACQSSKDQKVQWPVDLDELSTLHCQSIKLKNERFSLADSIRFLQDSILVNEKLGNDISGFKDHLKELEIKKDVLAAQSYALSDSIESKIKLVIRDLNQDEKRIFNDSLNALTLAKGCTL